MKILAIGGSGGMGRFAVKTLQDLETIEQIVVADLNADSAQSFANEMNDKVSAMALDVSDALALQNAMNGMDVVMNTCGPFFRFGVPILQASINTGCHYFDICDDWEPTLEMLALDQTAKDAGVCATVGLGASPGVSNLLALIAMQELDSVNTVYTGWNLGTAKPEEASSHRGTNAAMIHAVEQMTGRVSVFRSGDFEMARPLAPVSVHYPGLPSFTGSIFGHPEAITFPTNYPQLRESLNLAHGGGIDSWQLKGIMRLVDWRLISKDRAAGLLTWFEQNTDVGAEDNASDPRPIMYGLAIGTKNGRPASVGVSLKSPATQETDADEIGMGAITGIPLACGIKFLADGQLYQPGVLSPESGHIEPKAFLSEVLIQLGKIANFSSTAFDDHIEIARSW
jgi:saccharopine dehydrogenase-like NADP-dependent oxidoreductase